MHLKEESFTGVMKFFWRDFFLHKHRLKNHFTLALLAVESQPHLKTNCSKLQPQYVVVNENWEGKENIFPTYAHMNKYYNF